jgi:hypothetical protein
LHTYKTIGGTCGRNENSADCDNIDRTSDHRPPLAPRCPLSRRYRRWRALARGIAGLKESCRRMRACVVGYREQKSRWAAFSTVLTPTSKSPSPPPSPSPPFSINQFNHHIATSPTRKQHTPTHDGPCNFSFLGCNSILHAMMDSGECRRHR